MACFGMQTSVRQISPFEATQNSFTFQQKIPAALHIRPHGTSPGITERNIWCLLRLRDSSSALEEAC